MIPPVFEKVLEEVGDSGQYQRLLYWLFLLPINFLIPWTALVTIFMTSTPEHWCHVPGRPQNTPTDQWKELTIPREKDGSYSSCLQYNVTRSDLEDLINTTPSPQDIMETFGTTKCKNGAWEYEDSDYEATLTTQRHWVCDTASMGATWMSVGLIGNVVGTVIFNSLSDQIGRRPVILMTVCMYAVFGLVRLYVTSLFALMITTFLASTSFPPVLELSLIIVMEQVSPGWRASITSVSFIMWTCGMCVLPLIAWLVRDWQTLGLVTTLPFYVILIGCWFLLPESPRWLLSRGKIDQCSRVLESIAVRNGKSVPSSLSETLQTIVRTQKTERNYGALQLFKHRVTCTRTLLLTACYSSYNFFYYGITYNTSNVSGNEFLNFFILGVVELPSNLLAWLSSQTLGRRWTAAGSSMLAAVFALATAFLQYEAPWLPLTILVVSKIFITISFAVIYIQCSEVYPTTHRAAGTGLSSLVSSCLGVATPYIAYLSVHGLWAPYVTLSLVGVFGFLVASLLPETLDADLPQSLSDANTFLTSEKYWSYKGRRCCCCSEKQGIPEALVNSVHCHHNVIDDTTTSTTTNIDRQNKEC